jgi:hypothetical protein
MEAEKLNINFAEGQQTAEVIIREVDQVVEQQLPVLEPEKVSIQGNITAPFSFLEKRWNAEDNQVDHNRTHITVDRDNLSMGLRINETDKRNTKYIQGQISMSRQYIAFGINSGKCWTPEDLGQFFRVNRTYFEKPEECNVLVSTLRSFKAKVHTTMEKTQLDNGSRTDNYRQAVDSNLPKDFFINIPVFKGTAPEKIKIETIAHVSGDSVSLELISADAAAIEEEVRDRLIDRELDKIRELAPEIPIIEI